MMQGANSRILYLYFLFTMGYVQIKIEKMKIKSLNKNPHGIKLEII